MKPKTKQIQQLLDVEQQMLDDEITQLQAQLTQQRKFQKVHDLQFMESLNVNLATELEQLQKFTNKQRIRCQNLIQEDDVIEFIRKLKQLTNESSKQKSELELNISEQESTLCLDQLKELQNVFNSLQLALQKQNEFNKAEDAVTKQTNLYCKELNEMIEHFHRVDGLDLNLVKKLKEK